MPDADFFAFMAVWWVGVAAAAMAEIVTRLWHRYLDRRALRQRQAIAERRIRQLRPLSNGRRAR